MKPPMHVAKETDLAAIGFAVSPLQEQQQKTVGKLNELVNAMRSLSVIMETCTKCGICANQCHSYLGTDDFNNIPAARADLVRRIYKRYLTLRGKYLGSYVGAEEFDDQTLTKWLTYFYQCNECRRCARFCPFGIDTAEVTIAARHILSELGIMPKFMQGITANMIKSGNNMGIPKPAIIDCAEFMEEEIKEETGLDIKIPIDKPNSDVLYIPSSADFFTNIDTMIGAAKLFYKLGLNWTISSSILEAANFGLLFNLKVMSEHNDRMKEAALSLGAKLVIQGECGHGWRAAKMYSEGVNGPIPFEIIHILDFCALNLDNLQLRKLPLRVTLHDPCNYARAGEICEQPRQILRACVDEFVEMTPNRDENFCCGGGSGILMDEMMEIRMKLGKMKADQVKALGKIDYLAMPCSICKAQIPNVLSHYGIDIANMGGVMDLVGKAIVLNE
ncbi:sulfate reduction electron transfer complex DsrMKJOP subunit DsrK [Dendrosporobacter sp. 1207_IL3150]|uniref:sulfate reduction electron transfer complex DsrMKJOP subunit DsrK n=1 Tax=Dendrosporobacter sp. 1207_IL3150 TaxID=3084054 RepID=UPI002FD95452